MSNTAVATPPRYARLRAVKRAVAPEGWGTLAQYGAIVLLVFLAVVALFPLYFCTITSLKPPSDVATYPPSFVLRRASLQNYRDFLEGAGISNAPVSRWFLNSALVTAANTFGGLLVCSLAGYSFARKRFWGRNALFSLLIGTMLVPGWATLIALYALTLWLKMHDTYWVLILPGLASPFAVFLVRQFMLTLPSELFQAATVDGASELQLYARIAVPLCKPVLAALGLFIIIGTWNDFLWPLLVLNKVRLYTVQVGLSVIMYQIQGAGPAYGIGMAAAILTSAVPIAAFLLMQRQMVQG
ncbi:MAG: carbohydrate ABC transporter permease, partial [Anaerolineae bacterium]